MSKKSWPCNVDYGHNNDHGFEPDELGYLLYLEGLARELSHLLQNQRKQMGLDVLDYVDVGVVQDPCNQLTTAALVFSQYLKEKARIRRFLPNPLGGADCQSHCVTCSLGNKYEFTTYCRRVSDSMSMPHEVRQTTGSGLVIIER